MKIDKLIGILSILLQKDKITSQDLANIFEVSRRTILRDVDALSMAGIPIISEQGQGGGISIMEGYKVDRTLLSSEEMKAILTGLQSLDSVSGTNQYRQLMEKLSLDGSVAINMDNHFIIDLSNWDKSTVSDKIKKIKIAMEQNLKIAFHYFSPKGESWRIIDEIGEDYVKYNENDEIYVTFTWSNIPAFYEYILSFGDQAEIVSPMKYRQYFK